MELFTENRLCKQSSMITNVQNISKLCRTCLMENTLTPIIGEFMDKKIPNLLKYLVGIQINDDIYLPSMICNVCLPQLNLACEFKYKCHLSEERLQQYIEKTALFTVTKGETENGGQPLVDFTTDNTETVTSKGSHTDQILQKSHHTKGSTKQLILKSNKRNSSVKTVKNMFYRCVKCKKKFTNQKAFLRHLKISHEIKKPLKCDKCEKCYSTPESLKDHFMVIHEGRRWTCNICKQEFKYSSSFLMHKKYHKGDKRHSCEICKETFVKKLELMIHLKNIHWTPDANMDSEKVKNNLIVKKNLYNCTECPAVFTTGAVLKRHTSVVHNNVRTFLCSECGHASPSAAALRSHILRHTGDKNLPCPHCDMRFTWRAALKSHISSHTGLKPYLCAECGQGFNSAGTRREHSLRHHTEAPLACHHCPLRFTRAPQLAKHARVHAGEQLYPCEQCTAKYSHKSSLTIHYKTIHKAVMPYKCKFCSEAFSNCKKLYKHRVNQHPTEKRAKVLSKNLQK